MTRSKVLCVIVAVLFVLLMCAMAEAQLADRYTRDAVIVEVDGHIVSAEDTTGNVWCYEIEDDVMPQADTHVVLTLLRMGTDTIYDDQVIEVE